MRIAVVGGGSWGTAFASHLAGRGHDVDLLARDAAHAAEIQAVRENAQYLPGVRIADALRVGPLAGGIPPDVGLVVLAIPRARADGGSTVTGWSRKDIALGPPREDDRPAAGYGTLTQKH